MIIYLIYIRASRIIRAHKLRHTEDLIENTFLMILFIIVLIGNIFAATNRVTMKEPHMKQCYTIGNYTAPCRFEEHAQNCTNCPIHIMLFGENTKRFSQPLPCTPGSAVFRATYITKGKWIMVEKIVQSVTIYKQYITITSYVNGYKERTTTTDVLGDCIFLNEADALNYLKQVTKPAQKEDFKKYHCRQCALITTSKCAINKNNLPHKRACENFIPSKGAHNENN